MYWPALAPALFAVLLNVYVFLVRPARGRQKAARTEPPGLAPERREPRDTSRPYPCSRDISPDDPRLAVCPVCGMEDPLFLDGGPTQTSFFGWPAHATCVEWLGKWEPPLGPRPMPKYWCAGTQAVPSGPVYLGGTAVTIPSPAGMTPEQIKELQAALDSFQPIAPGGWPITPARAVNDLTAAHQAGMITIDELRERIVGAFGYPQMSISATSSTTGTATCDCGMSFSGSAADLDRSMEVHRTSGQHEQAMAYRHGPGA